LNLHKEVEKDYTGKYDKYRINNSKSEIDNEVLPEKVATSTSTNTIINVEDTDI
jgi:hypothetical protein